MEQRIAGNFRLVTRHKGNETSTLFPIMPMQQKYTFLQLKRFFAKCKHNNNKVSIHHNNKVNFTVVYTCNPPYMAPLRKTHFALLWEHYSSAVAVMRILIV